MYIFPSLKAIFWAGPKFLGTITYHTVVGGAFFAPRDLKSSFFSMTVFVEQSLETLKSNISRIKHAWSSTDF